MTVDTNTMVSITEANQNFSKVARLVDEASGSIVSFEANLSMKIMLLPLKTSCTRFPVSTKPRREQTRPFM